MSEKITVSGAIVSKNGVTLFTNTGQSQVFGSESWRTAAILEAVLVPLAKAQAEQGFGATIEIDLSQFSLAKQIEAVTGGAVKVEERVEDGVSKMALTTASGARIEDASAIEKLVDRAAVEGGEGLAKFIERFGRLDHKHTADELLKFIKKMDLPIADDGCIVVYKYLDKTRDEGLYADKHTGKVRQRLGSRVSMPLEKTDKSRALCSSGLHVCSNRYGSYGDTVFLAKVDPADVVAIPEQEAGKMRVSAYHLVALLDQASYASVANRKSVLSTKSGNHLVANVIAGNHPAVLEEVVVGGSFYTNKETATLKVTPVAQPVKESPLKPVREIAEAPRIDPKAVRDKLAAATSGDMAAALSKAVQAANIIEKPKGWEENLKPGQKVMLQGREVTFLEYGVSTRRGFIDFGDHRDWADIGNLSPVPAEVPSPALNVQSALGASTPSEPWELAKVGDTVRVAGSNKIPDGDYLVDRVSNDGRASRVRVKSEQFGSIGVNNTLVKAIVASKDPTAVQVAEKAVSQAVNALSSVIATVPMTYEQKLAEAKRLKAQGKSLREIEKTLKMCRKALSAHLKAA